MKYLFFLILIFVFAGCGKKKFAPDPVLKAMMDEPVTCVKCRKTALRRSYQRVNQVLVRCSGCEKVFPVNRKNSVRKQSCR